MAKHVLIVDDSKTVRNLVAFIMKKEGLKVTVAEDGLDGLEKLYAAGQVDLIISDINMPKIDGFTFIKTIREQNTLPRYSHCGAFDQGAGKRRQAGLKMGANMYMVKPARPEKMLRNMKMLLWIVIIYSQGDCISRGFHRIRRFMRILSSRQRAYWRTHRADTARTEKAPII